MFNSLIKGDEVRQGKLVILDAASKNVIESLPDDLLSERMLSQLNDGSTPLFPMSAKQVMEAYKSGGELTFVVRLRSDKICIGSSRLANIDWKSRHAQLFIGVFSEAHFTLDVLVDVIQTMLQFAYWEANLNRIYVHCIADNILLQEALEMAGFTNEGRFRQEAYRNGRYLDKIIYGILQREWSN